MTDRGSRKEKTTMPNESTLTYRQIAEHFNAIFRTIETGDNRPSTRKAHIRRFSRLIDKDPKAFRRFAKKYLSNATPKQETV